MIRFLHFAKDDKFLESTIKGFLKEENIISDFIVYRHKYIKREKSFAEKCENVEILSNKREVISRLKSNTYDVLYIHSFYINFWYLLKYVPDDKIIIWWVWGYDIYSPGLFGLNNFLELDYLKPLTKIAISKSRPLITKIKYQLFRMFYSYKFENYKKSLINRVDYVQPVLPIEFKMLKNIEGFHAKEFYRPNLISRKIVKDGLLNKKRDGSILIGNSASCPNNHLDVWINVNHFIPKGRRIIIPLSYGDRLYGKYVKDNISSDSYDFVFLDNFLDKEDYFNLMNSCTYAIYGSIRQHAIGNIFNAIKRGVKIFLFKDSIIYKYLSQCGFAIYTIEDIDENSFWTPLTMRDHIRNGDALLNYWKYQKDIGQKAIEEITNRLSK